MDNKITESTPEQWEQIEACRLRWLNEEQTAQYPVEDIRAEVLATLERIKHPAVPVWVVDSPLIARVISGLTTADLHANMDANMHANLRADLRKNLDKNLDENLTNLTNLRVNLSGYLRANLDENLDENLDTNLANLDTNLDTNLDANLMYYCGIWWGSWAGWYEGATILGVPEIPEQETFFRWTRLCPVWMWDKRQIFILRRPTEIHWGDNGLHNESGPSVYYSPLFSLWHIDGIPVDAQIVMAPETQTLEQIDKEDNADVRAIRIDRFGWPRYLRESNAECLDSRDNEIEGTKEALYRSGEQMRLVATCPTGRVFSMAIPNKITTCLDAAKWLQGPVPYNLVTRT